MYPRKETTKILLFPLILREGCRRQKVHWNRVLLGFGFTVYTSLYKTMSSHRSPSFCRSSRSSIRKVHLIVLVVRLSNSRVGDVGLYSLTSCQTWGSNITPPDLSLCRSLLTDITWYLFVVPTMEKDLVILKYFKILVLNFVLGSMSVVLVRYPSIIMIDCLTELQLRVSIGIRAV